MLNCIFLTGNISYVTTRDVEFHHMLANALIQDRDNATQMIEETFALMDEVVALSNVYDCGKLSDITRLELFQFIAYLAGSDDEVRQEEADFINSYFGTNWTPQELAAYLMENGIHNEGFDKMIPLSLEVLVQADKVLKQDGLLRRETISKTLISLYQLVGNMFIKGAPHPSNWEAHDLDAYIEHLKQYVSQNFKNTPESLVEATTIILPQKSELSRTESGDVGIAAPSKEEDMPIVEPQTETHLSSPTLKKDEDSGIIAPRKS